MRQRYIINRIYIPPVALPEPEASRFYVISPLFLCKIDSHHPRSPVAAARCCRPPRELWHAAKDYHKPHLNTASHTPRPWTVEILRDFPPFRPRTPTFAAASSLFLAYSLLMTAPSQLTSLCSQYLSTIFHNPHAHADGTKSKTQTRSCCNKLRSVHVHVQIMCNPIRQSMCQSRAPHRCLQNILIDFSRRGLSLTSRRFNSPRPYACHVLHVHVMFKVPTLCTCAIFTYAVPRHATVTGNTKNSSSMAWAQSRVVPRGVVSHKVGFTCDVNHRDIPRGELTFAN